MTTLLPKDADNNAIPALRLKDNDAHSIAVTATSARNTTAFNDDTKVISIYATADIFIRFGDNTTVATTSDHFFPGGVYYDIAITGGSGKGPHNSHLAVVRSTEDSTLYISEKE